MAQRVVKNLLAMQEMQRFGFGPWVGKIPWRRVWQPTPVFLPGEFHGQRSLAGYSQFCSQLGGLILCVNLIGPWGAQIFGQTLNLDVSVRVFLIGVKQIGASLVAQTVMNPPAVWETWVRSLGQEDPLEEGVATHSNILAWKVPCTEEPSKLQSLRSERVDHS